MALFVLLKMTSHLVVVGVSGNNSIFSDKIYEYPLYKMPSVIRKKTVEEIVVNGINVISADMFLRVADEREMG
jgi:hypothetical protein